MAVIFSKKYLSLKFYYIEWVYVQTSDPIAIIFIPPLIGGNYSQQIRYFRRLLKKRYNIVSFNYSGHGSSTDKFSLDASIRDTYNMLNYAKKLAIKDQLPLYGIGSCYAAIPVLYAAKHLSEPFKKIILINAVFDLKPTAVIKSFFSYYREIYRSQNTIPRFIDSIKLYSDFMFPGILKNRHSFGMLARRRTRIIKTVYDFFTLNPLKNICLNNTSILCMYSADDRVLNIYDGGSRLKYENNIKKICPAAYFYPLSGDHFLSRHTIRNKAVKKILSFMENQDN